MLTKSEKIRTRWLALLITDNWYRWWITKARLRRASVSAR